MMDAKLIKGFIPKHCNYCGCSDKMPWEMKSISMCFDCYLEFSRDRNRIIFERRKKGLPVLTPQLRKASMNVIIQMFNEGKSYKQIRDLLLIDIRFVMKTIDDNIRDTEIIKRLNHGRKQII